MHIQHKLSHFWKVELKTTVMDHGALKLEMHNKRINQKGKAPLETENILPNVKEIKSQIEVQRVGSISPW